MMNVGENRAQNGVTDCPESRNEENFQSIELLDSSRYAMKFEDPSRYATDLKYLKSSGFLRGKRSLIWPVLRQKSCERTGISPVKEQAEVL
ncbi:hypothetical protein E3N88_07489 [Mikania micrantha]|uniref:Uncharacterized protein n=1 Tax=Mikania micrantha TaxID=192012 RepID=A0A5N6PRM9_9ASTR|nr:hypothetical protein E3N88_07489 [Mikania micrantha]